MVTRHEFLTQLHNILRPTKYLEVGVQYGASLNLATFSQSAIGVDPRPLCHPYGNQQIFPVTSDDFFTYYMAPEDWTDFAFIDGSHLFEDALRDFINIEHHSHERTVVVFDDVLPLNSEMTSRTMVPGHWTGDVWKLYPILKSYRPHLSFILADTEPTGTMVVWNLDRNDVTLPSYYEDIVSKYVDAPVPDYIVNRVVAIETDHITAKLADWMAASSDRA